MEQTIVNKIPSGAMELLSCLNDAGFEGYLVGGCVRDICRGVEPHDYDITTNATPSQMQTVFSRFHIIETGLKHGTLTVRCEHQSYEVTTFRTDGTYADHRHPDSVTFTASLRDDLARRDFTINAMALGKDGFFVDLFGGMNDLNNHVIRCVGQAEKRFDEDGLRIMRALRFASCLNFTIAGDVQEAIHKKKDLLSFISVERIFVELKKMIVGVGVEPVLLEYPDVLAVVIPEIMPCVGFNQQSKHHSHDVWKHTVKAVASSSQDEWIRLALLFHDLGKPSCFSINEQGGHFYGHPQVSKDICHRVLTRLHSDNDTCERVSKLVEYHDTVFTATPKQWRKLIGILGREDILRLLAIHRADVSGQDTEETPTRLQECDVLQQQISEILEQENCFVIKDLAVNGFDLLQMGVPKGPAIGLILSALLNAVLEERCENNRQSLLSLAENMKESM